ncbi:MAG: hypothetical protein J0M18_06970 [Ignavibacteria bacterium]|nr:hypothetical protein [Ignavibacteria bacterium]
MKAFLFILFFIFILSGCSKENKNSSGEIKIEQNTPPKETPVQTPKEELKNETKPEVKTEEQIQQDKQVPQQTQKPEAVSLKSKQTAKYIGKNAVVTGYITDVYKNEKVAYLNFDGKFPKNSCAAVIFKDDFGKFGDLNRFKNKNVEVSGIISEYNGKPQIILKSTSQLKVTD